ncbi:MAG: RibD family protein [Reyranella sp.]|uniref:RibD family protein n=1 Tax=Reyranella sp. TaxID=1929291 RepID=UPI003D103926
MMGRRTAEPDSSWDEVPRLIRAGMGLPQPWEKLFGPLRATSSSGILAVGQIGQTLDGRVATLSGHSHYINGSAGLDHLHRLRAVVDAVVVGAGTVRADDPQLTVRRVAGPNPVRVVLDPRGTLGGSARVFAADGTRRIVITLDGTPTRSAAEIETIALAGSTTRLEPAAILDALSARGLRRVLIEGGARTVSHFLGAGCLDRLHVMVAPVILGSGLPGLELPPVARMTDALRAPVRVHLLDDEVLFDCDLSARRAAAGAANKSR